MMNFLFCLFLVQLLLLVVFLEREKKKKKKQKREGGMFYRYSGLNTESKSTTVR